MNIILVNKQNKLSENYKPKNLVTVDQNRYNFHHYIDPNHKPKVTKEVLKHFNSLKRAAKKDNLHLRIGSGYRSYKYQEKIYNTRLEQTSIEHVTKYIAKPGTSEHQTGLAIDISYKRNNKLIINTENDSKEYDWMQKKAYKYGFILRYPKNKEYITGYNYEPWHYRYVGKEIAKEIYEKNLTLEEYLSIKSV